MKTVKMKKIPKVDNKMSNQSVVQLVDWLEELQNLTQAMARKIIELREDNSKLTLIVKQLDERMQSYERPQTKH
jgi:phosphopantothenate synthetase